MGGDEGMGAGWSLQGLGFIERLGPTYSAAPTYTDSDTFILNFNGSSKLVYSTSDPSGTPGNASVGYFYRTQVERFLRIRRDINNNYWAITDKDGIEYVFGVGGVTQSRQYNPGSNETRTFRWHLERVVYPHGTRWDVHYVRDAIDGDHYSKQIMYTGGVGGCSPPGNLSTCRTVEFDYETRTDRIVSYRTGARIVNDQRLRQIDVKMAGVLVRRYALAYKMSILTNRAYASASQLISISEIGADGTLSLWPTQFSYNVDTNGSSLAFAGITMIGEPPEGLGDPPPLSNPPTASDCAFNVDLDGDQLSDIVVGRDAANGGYNYYRNLGANNYGARTAIQTPPTALPSLCQIRVEFRGDNSARNIFDKCLPSISSDGNAKVNAEGGSNALPKTIEILHSVHNTALVDMDGDRLPDVFYSPAAGQWFWWRNLRNNTFRDRLSISNPPTAWLNTPHVGSNVNKSIRLAAMDADGLVDIVEMIMTASRPCLENNNESADSEWTVKVFRNQGPNALGNLAFAASITNSERLVIHSQDVDAPTRCLYFLDCERSLIS